MNRFKPTSAHRLGQVNQNFIKSNLVKVASQKACECKCDKFEECDEPHKEYEPFELQDIYHCVDNIKPKPKDDMDLVINTKSNNKYKINTDLCINKTYPSEWA